MHEHFIIRGNKAIKEDIETSHNNIIIKPTLQYNCKPRLDPPCVSVSTHFKQDDEKN
jgi:hypothetical protein